MTLPLVESNKSADKKPRWSCMNMGILRCRVEQRGMQNGLGWGGVAEEPGKLWQIKSNWCLSIQYFKYIQFHVLDSLLETTVSLEMYGQGGFLWKILRRIMCTIMFKVVLCTSVCTRTWLKQVTEHTEQPQAKVTLVVNCDGEEMTVVITELFNLQRHLPDEQLPFALSFH